MKLTIVENRYTHSYYTVTNVWGVTIKISTCIFYYNAYYTYILKVVDLTYIVTCCMDFTC